MKNKNMVILNGSPRKKGTSYSFSLTIKKLVEERGSKAEIVHIIDYYDGNKDLKDLGSLISACDIVGLVCPYYVDTLPSPVIWLFEKIRSEFAETIKGKGFFAVSQNGFPDISLFKAILGTCRCFSESVGMNWLGGLAYGGGAIINGKLMEDLGKKGAKITSGFKAAVNDILEGKCISHEAQELLTVKVPKIAYRPFAAILNHMSRSTAKKMGAKDIYRKVYLED
ncbi:MAG: hypothetical protein Q8920_13045 [Bacillota bacterium]|nr:hypothetical protein [Bacillota bacterium]